MELSKYVITRLDKHLQKESLPLQGGGSARHGSGGALGACTHVPSTLLRPHLLDQGHQDAGSSRFQDGHSEKRPQDAPHHPGEDARRLPTRWRDPPAAGSSGKGVWVSRLPSARSLSPRQDLAFPIKAPVRVPLPSCKPRVSSAGPPHRTTQGCRPFHVLGFVFPLTTWDKVESPSTRPPKRTPNYA